jgi:lipopolysaccharide heptosyltransferase I
LSDTRSPRLLICRLSHIGDCIHTFPVANALRDHYPNSLIGWVVERPSAPLLAGHESVDELIVVPRRWLKQPGVVWRLRRRLRQLKFDIAVDPQSLTKSSVAAWLSGAKVRIGYAGKDGLELSKCLNNQLVTRKAPHVVDRYLEVLRPLGISSPQVQFRVPVDEEADAAIGYFLKQQGLLDAFAVINPGAGWDSKLWPIDRYAAVAAYLGRRWHLPTVVVWAGDRERQWAEQIVAGSQSHAVMAPPTSLPELASLLRGAQLFVGSDTGPMHLAVAVGTRCVAMFGPTPISQCGPYGEGHVALQEVYKEQSRRERRRAGNEAMRAIQTESVCRACDTILADRMSEKAA